MVEVLGICQINSVNKFGRESNVIGASNDLLFFNKTVLKLRRTLLHQRTIRKPKNYQLAPIIFNAWCCIPA